MHVIQALSLPVIGFEVVIGNRPSWRDATEVPDLAKILATQAKQGCAVKFCVTTDVIIRMRMKRIAVFVPPLFPRLVLCFYVDGVRVPIRLFATYVAAAFENEDFLAGWSEGIGECSAPCARADDDYVEMLFPARHAFALLIIASRSESDQLRCSSA